MSKLGHYIPKTQGQYMPKVVARLACHNKGHQPGKYIFGFNDIF